MATQKSKAFPYKWPNGTYHSRPYNTGAGAPAKSVPQNYVNTPTGAIGVNTASAMQGLAASTGAGQSGNSAPPFDPGLAAQQATNSARRSTMLGDMDVDLQQTAQETGFQYNPATGAFGGFDPTNPFSQAALLLKTRNESGQATKQAFAQSGQLYSGAANSAQRSVQSNYDRGYDTLRRGFDDYVKRYLRKKRDVQTVDPNELASLA